MIEYNAGRPEWPVEERCFVCNEEIDFFSKDEWELTLSFSGSPRGASRPRRLFFAHEACLARVSHPAHVDASRD